MKMPGNIFKREHGFTLIEILVVVAILGVLAGVVIPNVVKFMHEGKVESANTELANVRLAVLSAMVDAEINTLNDGGTVGSGHTSNVSYGSPSVSLAVHNFVMGEVIGIYTLNEKGLIVSALMPEGSDWANLTFVSGAWQ
ncbi:general secretion pathway protein GspH [Dehalococcoides mccartyi]|uniref:General secretion pathway protein GspH n=1 Tax=Dehalococcoides mccartyi TaxID=61435 RepID=A0A0V8M3V7_9CHLR|nr:type II secretion system protein [Dehalococcoides mccartyi]KSV18446.1 general secretion pathway protein GspH [Dehalococcoides mccartyi]